MRTNKKILAAAICGAILGAGEAHGVHLDPDGLGQALIYPYYTTRTADGNPFNTYISVVNTSGDAKAIRVRFREGIAGKPVLDFNLYLSPNDVWAAAMVPSGAGALVNWRDNSCTLPAPPVLRDGSRQLTLSGAAYATDGLGSGLDRLREGYIEMIEMASLTGASAAAVTHDFSGLPDDCHQITSGALPGPGEILAPTGGLMGTVTLMNVANGQDFTTNAVALGRLTAASIYRVAGDPYPDFGVPEVTPESQMLVDGTFYDLKWTSGRDAVTSVLMSTRILNEFVLDSPTRSQTDWVVTMPTQRMYAGGEAPFAVPFVSVNAFMNLFDREAKGVGTAGVGCFPMEPGCPLPWPLRPVSVLPIRPETALAPSGTYQPSEVLGSRNVLPVPTEIFNFESGWASYELSSFAGWSMESAPGSSSTDPRTGAIQVGRFRVGGLPVTGFMVRTFQNGLLRCAGTSGYCQGNYGGSFAHRYRREITYVGP